MSRPQYPTGVNEATDGSLPRTPKNVQGLHVIHRGLDLPVPDAPGGPVVDSPQIQRVAVLPGDFCGLRPRLRVEEGDFVRAGDSLFAERTSPGVSVTSPGTGRIIAIHRGAKRILESIEIELEEDGDPGRSFGAGGLSLSRADLVSTLCASGLWSAFRTRPFGFAPPPDSVPFAIFVTAIDTQPLAPDPELVVLQAKREFRLGLLAVARLTDGDTFLCVADGSSVGDVDAPVRVERFAGPHPAGLPGLHIHRLAPVGRKRMVWQIGYQDVIAIGRLVATGYLSLERIVSIAGPPVTKPRLVRTRLGASIRDLTAEDCFDSEVRYISGSMLSGVSVTKERFAYLSRFDCQVTVLKEDRERTFLGWLAPGRRTFSVFPAFVSRWFSSRMDWATSTHGARRAIVPTGCYERVMPMDILPTFLLRALLAGDVERAEELGCLELCEEDLALCSFVCPSKIDYGLYLRHALEMIAKESA